MGGVSAAGEEKIGTAAPKPSTPVPKIMLYGERSGGVGAIDQEFGNWVGRLVGSLLNGP